MIRDAMDMGTTSPIDPPVARVERALGPRRHRRITAPAGLLLFLCMFLPAVKGCHEPVYPLDMPMFLPPYLYGLALAFAACALTARRMKHAITIVRVITAVTVAGSVILMALLPPLGIVELLASLLLFSAIGVGGHSERRVATVAMVVGFACTLWFGVWSTTDDALIGVYLSLAASVGLLLGGIIWLGETVVLREAPIVLPRAVVRIRE